MTAKSATNFPSEPPKEATPSKGVIVFRALKGRKTITREDYSVIPPKPLPEIK
jgi:hypothetical protein